ncbi:MAG: hypothetical protein R2911_30140 [Caldilineaceae bacterium]
MAAIMIFMLKLRPRSGLSGWRAIGRSRRKFGELRKLIKSKARINPFPARRATTTNLPIPLKLKKKQISLSRDIRSAEERLRRIAGGPDPQAAQRTEDQS